MILLKENAANCRRPVKVINPFLLYEAKATNVVQIDQIKESGSRRDRSQLGIMGIVVNKVLSELASTQGAERALVKASGRLLNFWLSSNGAALVREIHDHRAAVSSIKP